MARPLRIEYEGAVHHVTSRGNARAEIFRDDDDRNLFLEILSEVVTRYCWSCHGYCLMSNHYHLLIETPSPSLSRGMQLLNGIYTQKFNRQNKKSGHVFQGRFKAILVEKESYLLELARYVVLNPVRARMVHSASDWPWSNYLATCGQSEAPEFLETDWTLSQFDAKRARAIRAYRHFVGQGHGLAVWDGLRAGSLMGSDAFVEHLRPLLRDMPLDPNVLRREHDVARPSLEDLFSTMSDKATRDELIYRATRTHHYKLQEVGDHLGLHFSTISVIANRVAEVNRDSNIKA
ncbi:MAG: transposase [Candidatus Atribacteria bacterium]|nr:MAG: transposase [Candidatus Atribacteria bacterium]